MKNMRGHGYDGAANMSGMYKGLRARICTHNEKALYKVLKAVLKLLTDISESDPPDLATWDAQMYLNAINFKFLLCLEITTPVFQITALASDALQQKDLDTLKTNRSEEEFKTIFEIASEKAESLDIPIPTVLPGQ
ncbi:unnamed protein product [Merluccius merluccius]